MARARKGFRKFWEVMGIATGIFKNLEGFRKERLLLTYVSKRLCKMPGKGFRKERLLLTYVSKRLFKIPGKDLATNHSSFT